MNENKKKNLMGQAKAWAHKNNLHGKTVFPRYMMLLYLEGVQKISPDFVFKGGNLLWHYIKTPRETVDLDLATLTLDSHSEVKNVLEKVSTYYEEVRFVIKSFKEVDQGEGRGAAITLEYQTVSRAKNQFDIDIVYALPTDLKKVRSTLNNEVEYVAASLENIICDKVSASYRFASGNTRMKDFDDLWRLSQSQIKIDDQKIQELFEKRNLKMTLDFHWIGDDLENYWIKHARHYKDLPASIHQVFTEINQWLEEISK